MGAGRRQQKRQYRRARGSEAEVREVPSRVLGDTSAGVEDARHEQLGPDSSAWEADAGAQLTQGWETEKTPKALLH